MTRTTTISSEKRANLLRRIRSYNPRITEQVLDQMIAEQGVEMVEFAILCSTKPHTPKADKAQTTKRSPLAGMFKKG